MSATVFTIRHELGRASYDASTGVGSFSVTGGVEVVLHPPAVAALLHDVGADGFALLTAMALCAQRDEHGRLVVTGGVQRLREMLRWGKERALNVFNELEARGFTHREQGVTGPESRYGRVHLVLSATLYDATRTAPSATVIEAPGQRRAGVGIPDSGSPDPGSADPGPAASGSPVPGGTDPDPRRRKRRGGAGRAGVGRPAVGAAGSHGHEHVDEIDPSSDGMSVCASGVETLRWVHDMPPRQAVAACLERFGFADASHVVATVEMPVLLASLYHVAARESGLRNPGGYLRSMLAKGGPAQMPVAGEAARVKAAFAKLGLLPEAGGFEARSCVTTPPASSVGAPLATEAATANEAVAGLRMELLLAQREAELLDRVRELGPQRSQEVLAGVDTQMESFSSIVRRSGVLRLTRRCELLAAALDDEVS